MGLRSRLGKAAVIGGVSYVERFAYSDEFAAIFLHGLDSESRKAALVMVGRILSRAQAAPAASKPPSRDNRVKVRWTEEFKGRFLAAAPLSKDDFDLCRRLGLPPYCRGAMRAARSRYGFLRGPCNQAGPQSDLPRARGGSVASGTLSYQAASAHGLCTSPAGEE